MDDPLNQLNSCNRTGSLFDSASFYYPSCSSTNGIAQKYALQRNVAEGSVFITDYQYKGKGQRGNRWVSAAAQNLLFSLILYPEWLAIDHFFSLNIITSLAIYDALVGHFPEGIAIKWPNDIYYLDKKLGGILIETTIGNRNKIKTAVVGIGLNVNQLDFEFPKATSLALHKGKAFERSLLLTDIVDLLGNYYGLLQSGLIDLLWTKYLDRLYRKNGLHIFETLHRQFEGSIVTVNGLGALVVMERNGCIDSYKAKEIAFI